jgi:hypothetical protein
LRRLTERPEASQFGMAKIVGMSREKIVGEADHLLTDSDAYLDMSQGENPYGDGHGSERIVEAVARWFAKKTPLLEPGKEFKLPIAPHPRRRKTDFADASAKAAAAGKKE